MTEMRTHRATGRKPRGRGRLDKRIIKLRATPEEVARALFSAVKPPDPRKRKLNAG